MADQKNDKEQLQTLYQAVEKATAETKKLLNADLKDAREHHASPEKIKALEIDQAVLNRNAAEMEQSAQKLFAEYKIPVPKADPNYEQGLPAGKRVEFDKKVASYKEALATIAQFNVDNFIIPNDQTITNKEVVKAEADKEFEKLNPLPTPPQSSGSKSRVQQR